MSGLYELKIFQSYAGQGIINRFFYGIGGSDANASHLTAWAAQTLLNPMSLVQLDDLEYLGISAKSVFPVGDEHVALLSGVNGGVIGEGLPAFVNSSITLVSDLVAGRKGAKRLAGLAEGSQNMGVYEGPIVTHLNALATVFASSYQVTIGSVSFVVAPMLRHELTTGNVTWATIRTAGVTPISTQNSRKSYKGGGVITPSFTDVTIKESAVPGTFVYEDDSSLNIVKNDIKDPRLSFSGDGDAMIAYLESKNA